MRVSEFDKNSPPPSPCDLSLASPSQNPSVLKLTSQPQNPSDLTLTTNQPQSPRDDNEIDKDRIDVVSFRRRRVLEKSFSQGFEYQPLDLVNLDHVYIDDYVDEMWFDESNDNCPDIMHADDIVPVSSTDEETNSIFLDAFFQNNRLDHVSQVMGYHPGYLRTFLATQNFLLREDGPLPYDYRHYIAIMAAARHHCTYLVKLQEQDFLLHNGNPEWLKGISHAPSKLQDLYEVNKILAHQPWQITREHIANLLRGSAWSLSELMHAIIILTHFHSLCSFIYGCGINAEIDLDGFTYNRLSSASDESSDSDRIHNGDSHDIMRDEESLGVEELMEKMRRLTESSSQLTSEEEQLKQFKVVEKENAGITVPSNKKSSPKAEILRYVKDSEFCYTDFDSSDKTGGYPIFMARDYSWEDHGFSLSNRLYSDVGNLLDHKFTTATQLTYYTMGDNQQVDTSSFRSAIWNHIHSMYGILHEDYDYSQVEQLLEFNLKAYMKTLTCYPERLQKKDYENVMREFKHSEKVHVNLMLMDARQQAELLYALRALNQYMT